MVPMLDESTIIDPAEEKKYVRVSDKIALADNRLDYHDQIAKRYFPDVERAADGKPIVDDTGLMSVYEEKVYFAGMPPETCRVKKDLKIARKRTKEVAISILGPERVG
jgi:hypothetical protein